MPFTIACPSCDAKLKANEALVGKTVKCPRCSKAVLIQAPKPTAVAAAPRLELPPSSPIDDEPAEAEFVDDEPAPPRTGREEIVDELPEVDDADDEVVEAELDRPADDDDYDRDRPRRKPARRPGGVTADDRQMAMFLYLSGLIAGFVIGPLSFVAPLVLWMMKRDQSRFIDHHGKEVLNFTITLALAGFIVGFVGVPVIFLTFGLGLLIVGPLTMALGIYGLVMVLIGAMKANQGEWYEFPISIRLIK